MCDIKYDEFGPLKVIFLHSEKAGLEAVVVIDNVALGPAIGGVRVSPAVTPEEVRRLARTMTLKNSIAGLAHGGGKAGIVADPRSPQKEHIFRIFAKLIRELEEYIPGPDLGSDEECMAWVYDETGRAAGLPEEIGGLPLDKLGATGYGLAACAEVACPFAGMEIKGARIAVQGFGSVGKAAARFLSERGAILVAASDTGGAIYNPDGIDVMHLVETKLDTDSVVNYAQGKRLTADEIFGLDADILIPAATADVINERNVSAIKARLILQGANIPATAAAEKALHERGVLSVPDFIANAGGVIMAAMEYEKRTEKEAFAAIEERIKKNTALILDKMKKECKLPRDAARELAMERVIHAEKFREF
jgi:glutamate dehydrogenase/leucine dehydrogenase